MLKCLFFILFSCVAGSIQAQQIEEGFQVFEDSVFYAYKNELDSAKNSQDAAQLSLAHFNLARFYKQSQIYTEAVTHYNAALENTRQSSQTTATIQNELAEIYI